MNYVTIFHVHVGTRSTIPNREGGHCRCGADIVRGAQRDQLSGPSK